MKLERRTENLGGGSVLRGLAMEVVFEGVIAGGCMEELRGMLRRGGDGLRLFR